MSISIALFVPKAQTPFQWDGQIPPEEAQRRVNILRRSVKSKLITVNWHDPKTSFIEAVMSRGGRECAAWVEAAWRHGAKFDAWSDLFSQQAWLEASEEVGIDSAAIAQRVYEPGYVLPWSHISTGISQKFFKLERERAEKGITTPDCTFEKCAGCGACQSLGSDNVLAQERVLGGNRD